MALIPIEDEEDDLDEDDLEIETLDDGEDYGEPGEGLGWPSALAAIVFFIGVASMWHDCFGHH